MICARVGLVKNIKNAAANKGVIMDDPLIEVITTLLLKITALEKILIDKKIISKEEYVEILNETLSSLQKVILVPGNKIN